MLIFIVHMIHFCLSTLTITIILRGVFQATMLTIQEIKNDSSLINSFKKARLILCQHILFGLEFMVASDVVLTVIAAQVQQLYILALLVLIRTVLSYFLDKESKEPQV